jgi:four helix bundle protein
MKIDIQERSLKFAVRVVVFCSILAKTFAGEIIAKQLLRSATSVGANLEEANAASSKKDFVNKISIACKECRETRYWLQIITEAKLICNANNVIELGLIFKESDELVCILSSIVKNSRLKK